MTLRQVKGLPSLVANYYLAVLCRAVMGLLPVAAILAVPVSTMACQPPLGIWGPMWPEGRLWAFTLFTSGKRPLFLAVSSCIGNDASQATQLHASILCKHW